jgi:hypothetical protein
MADKQQPAESGWQRRASWAGRFLDSKSGTLLVSLLFAIGMLNNRVFPLNGGLVGNDCYQMTWNLWWVNDAISHARNPYVTDTIYYPYGANLSHHTLAAGFFPITFLVKLVMRGDLMHPIFAYKISILVSYTLILYFSYLLLRELNLSRLVSATAAVAYAFCGFYMLHAPHLNHLAGFFIPLTALFTVRFYKRPASANALMAAVVAACSIYFTEFTLYIYLGTLLFVLSMCLFRADRQLLWEKLRLAGIKRLLFAFVIFILIQVPFVANLLPDHVLRPSYSESSFYSANLAGFFIPFPSSTPLYGNIFGALNSKITTGIPGYEVFLGYPLMIFALLALIKTRTRLIRICAVLALFFLILSLGPTLKVFGVDTAVPLPYSLLMHVPPFDVGRTPVRFFVIAIFFLMIVSAWGMTRMQGELARRRGQRWSLAAMTLLFVWVTAEAHSPIPKQAVFVPPPALDRIVEGPVLNLPPYPYDGYAAMLQVFHHQPIGTGFVARITRERLDNFRQLRLAADRGGQVFCDRLREMGFRNIIIEPKYEVPPTYQGGVVPSELSKCGINVVDLRDSKGEEPEKFPPYVLGTRIDVASSPAEKYLWYGWSGLEPEFRWTERSRAAIAFALSEVKPSILRIEMGAFLVPGKLDEQRVNIALNGHEIGTLNIRQVESREYTIAVPAEFLHEHNVVSFDLPNADSPVTFGLSNDDRLLGISVQWIEIDPAGSARPPS